MTRFKILVVDDKRENLDFAEEQFRGENVDLIVCPLYSVAIQLIKTHSFDIVLTDLMLVGESDGISGNNPEIGKEVPYGLVLSIFAKNNGVSHVAILTDINHHAGPIAWAMDQLIFNEGLFVKCYPHKDWLRAAKEFVEIEDSEIKKEEVKSSKKSLLICGVNDTFKDTLQKALCDRFFVCLLSEKESNRIAPLFTESSPDITLIIGEIASEAVKNAPNFSVKGKLDTLLSLKKEKQKVFVAGFMKSDHPSFLELPFTIDALLESFRE